MALGFTLAAMVAAVVHRSSWWLPLHLFVIGGLLSAISATTQMFAVTWSSSPAAPALITALQRWGLVIGAVAVVTGRENGITWLVESGGAIVAVSLMALVPILIVIRRKAITDRFGPAIEGYVVALTFGAVGTVIGVLLATGRGGGREYELRAAHLTINLFGLVGVVIAATLPYFAATQVRAKMARHATATVVRANIATLAGAVCVAVAGQLLDR